MPFYKEMSHSTPTFAVLSSLNYKTNILSTCYVQMKNPFMGTEICATDLTH